MTPRGFGCPGGAQERWDEGLGEGDRLVPVLFEPCAIILNATHVLAGLSDAADEALLHAILGTLFLSFSFFVVVHITMVCLCTLTLSAYYYLFSCFALSFS